MASDLNTPFDQDFNQSSMAYQQQEDQKIMKRNRDQTLKQLSNRFKVLFFLHGFILLCFIFSISFQQWYKLDNKSQTTDIGEAKHVWLNMLYVYDDYELGYIQFGNYRKSNLYYCKTNNFCNCDAELYEYCSETHCDNCEKAFRYLEFCGIFTFTCIALSIVLQVVDLFRLRQYMIKKQAEERDQNSIISKIFKGKYLHPITLACQIIGVSSYFLLIVFYGNDLNIWQNGTLGICYWVACVSCPAYIILQMIYRQTKGLLIDLELFDNLISQHEQFQSAIKDTTIGNNDSSLKIININNKPSSNEKAQQRKMKRQKTYNTSNKDNNQLDLRIVQSSINQDNFETEKKFNSTDKKNIYNSNHSTNNSNSTSNYNTQNQQNNDSNNNNYLSTEGNQQQIGAAIEQNSFYSFKNSAFNNEIELQEINFDDEI